MANPGLLRQLADITSTEETALAYLRQHHAVRRAAPGT